MNLLDEINLKLDTILSEIGSQTAKSENKSDQEVFMTVAEAASFLRLSTSRVYTLISKKELPFLKRTKRCYFLKSELIDYLKKGRELSNSEVSEATDNILEKRKG